jgi:hypothetical protein
MGQEKAKLAELPNPRKGETVPLKTRRLHAVFGAFLFPLLSDETFLQQLTNVREPVSLPLLIWRDLPVKVLTYMLQRSILGVESCVGAAVEYQIIARGLMTQQKAAQLNDLFKLPGKRRGTVETLYNKLPALVDPAVQLEIIQPDLWALTERFYKEVRNPLFHGYELNGPTAASVLDAMRLLERIYTWMDKWWGGFVIV